MERYASLVADALKGIFPTPLSADELDSPPDPAYGDFSIACFALAKAERKSPPLVAQELAKKISTSGHLPKDIEVSTVGPYLNFRVVDAVAIKTLLGDILAGDGDGTYGSKQGPRGKWVIEYSSPNVAKPFLIGHLRTTCLGAALDRIGKFRGFETIGINHLGDWGTQYGKLAVALQKFGSHLPAKPTIDDLVAIYVRFHEEAEKNPALEDEARAAFRKLEQGDPAIRALWKKCVDISLEEFKKIYDLLNVEFDYVWGESFYEEQMEPLLSELRSKNLLVESEGAWIVHLKDDKGNEMTPCILQKKDGGTIYATRDLAAAVYRYKKFNFDRMTYVVGGEQKLHFRQVFGVLKLAGFDWVSRCEHLAFGLYRFQGMKMSTRKGNFVTLRDVLEETETAVSELVEARESSASLSAEEKRKIARTVAVGAIVFHDLSTDPVKDVVFDLKSVISFEGDTGPYLQYAHTRCQSILRKAAEQSLVVGFDAALAALLSHPTEVRLVKKLGEFSRHLERVLKYAKPYQLSNFLIDVTKLYGNFYRECHVLNSGDAKLTRARLMLVEATRRVLARGLGLLGIPLPESM